MRWPIRGIIAFLFIWGVIFAVPLWQTRTLSGSEQRGQYLPDFVDLDLDKLLSQSPDNPFLQSLRLQKSWDPSMTVSPASETTTFRGITVAENKQRYNIATNASFFHDFDNLIAKHPKDLALRRTRLRLSIQSPFMGEGHFMSYQRRKHKESQNFWLTPKDASELSPVIVQTILKQAHQGAQTEPRNGFFPTVEAMALTSLKRYDEALAALEKAAYCPDFNDGSQDQFIQRLKLYAQNKPLSWDQKLVLSVGISTPFYGAIRSLYRDLIFRGIYLHEAGRKEEAWKHWSVPLHFAENFRHTQEYGSAPSLMGVLVGEALQAIAENSPLTEVGKISLKFNVRTGTPYAKQDLLKRMDFRIRAFEKFARAEGHPEIAPLVERERRDYAARMNSTFDSLRSAGMSRSVGWNSTEARISLQSAWFGWRVFLLSICGALAYVGAMLVTRGGREVFICRTTVLSATAFLIPLWLGMALWSALQGAGIEVFRALVSLEGDEFAALYPKGEQDLWSQRFWWFLAFNTFAMVACYYVSQYWTHQNTRDPKQLKIQLARAATWIIVAAGSFALIFWGTEWDFINENFALVLGLWLATFGLATYLTWQRQALQGLFWFFSAWGTLFFNYLNYQFSSAIDTDIYSLLIIWAIFTALALFLSWKSTRDAPEKSTAFHLACWSAFAMSVSITLSLLRTDNTIFAGFLSGALGLGLLLWNYRKTRPNLVTLCAPVELCGRVLANLALGLSLFYLMVNIAITPSDNTINRNMDIYLQKGDWYWLKNHM